MEQSSPLYSECIVSSVDAVVGMKKDIHLPASLYDRVDPCCFDSESCMESSVDL